jgi:hypothetical protein
MRKNRLVALNSVHIREVHMQYYMLSGSIQKYMSRQLNFPIFFFPNKIHKYDLYFYICTSTYLHLYLGQREITSKSAQKIERRKKAKEKERK